MQATADSISSFQVRLDVCMTVHTHLGFFLDPGDIRVLGMGAIWNFAKGTGLL